MDIMWYFRSALSIMGGNFSLSSVNVDVISTDIARLRCFNSFYAHTNVYINILHTNHAVK